MPWNWLSFARIGALVFLFGLGSQIAASVMNLTGDKAELSAQLKRLEGRYAGAVMRLERRDAAVAALPTQCRIQAQDWIKTGNIPVKFDPFKGDLP